MKDTSSVRHCGRHCHPGLYVIAALVLAGAAAVLFVPPIAQDPEYHLFADRRDIAGIANFWNVVSNLPFLLAGAAGLWRLWRHPPAGALPALRMNYLLFFAGVLLVSIGSGYYHLDPSNLTLVWDRLPMGIGFMAFFSIVIGEHISVAAGRRLLWPLVLAGLLSVIYWALTEQQGHGDLRAYALVQFLPMLLIPVILILFRSRLSAPVYLWLVIVLYAASKVAEWQDHAIYQLTGGFSGHALKHLLAAGGALVFLAALLRRTSSGQADDNLSANRRPAG